MNITASKEDYLKAILHLKEKNGYVRATDVVPEKVAEHDACRVEHYLSQESVVSIGGLVGEKTKNRQGEDTGQIDAGQKSEKRGGTQYGEKQYGGK